MGTDYNDIPKKKQEVHKKEDAVQETKEKKNAVVSAKVKRHKRNLLERLVVGMIGPDGIGRITTYLGKEIIVPAVKNIIVDSITSGVNMAVFGEERQAHRSSPVRTQATKATGYGRPVTNYATKYAPGEAHTSSRVKKANYVDEYIIESRAEAVSVVEEIQDSIATYGSASVADYYDLIGVETQYTDNTYGWIEESIGRMVIMPVSGGYLIKFPPVVLL